LTLLLACLVFAADTALHYTTSTINFDQVSISQTMRTYGRALSSECLNLNRTANLGLPCSRNYALSQTDYEAYVAGQNEIFFLQHDTSNISEVRLVSTNTPSASNSSDQVALLIPQSTNLSPFRDFRAETAGVITTCAPITSQCNWTISGPDSMYSQFNCSDNFWGVLGKATNVSATGAMVTDIDVPPLGFKPGPWLQYSFFMDENLTTPYDSTGSSTPYCMPDDQLINPVYLGVAARFASTSQRAGVNMTNDPEIHTGPTLNFDIILRCKYTTYAVDYSWVNSTAKINGLTPSPNGTMAEIYHGYNLVGSFTAFDNDLQDVIFQAALQENTDAFADSFANSYSSRVMSVIGPFLSSRTNLEEQTRRPLLVAKVPKIPLAILVACCLSYVLFGIITTLYAYCALSGLDVRDLAYRLSLPALGLHAFRDRATDEAAVDTEENGHRVFDETKIRGETMRVAVEGGPAGGFTLKSLL